MSVVTLHIPEEKHARLVQIAVSRHISIDRLFDELTTIAVVEHDLRTQFKAAAQRGDPVKGLAILDELDAHFLDSR